MNETVAWLLALALQFSPPAKGHQFPGYEETVEERTARYSAIAEDVYATVDKARVHFFSKQENAAFLLAVAIGESALDKDADVGPCYRGPGFEKRCDGGHAVGLVQLWTGGDVDAKLRAELFANRRMVLERGLRGMAQSFRACAHLPLEDRLAAYGGGICEKTAARIGSRQRYKLFKKLLSARKVPKWGATPQKAPSPEGKQKPRAPSPEPRAPEKSPEKKVAAK